MQILRAVFYCRQLIVPIIMGCLIVGCSGSKSGPKTVRVTGKVTYKNAGVEKAHVTFLGDGAIQSAQAITDKNGDFILTTSSSGDGAMPGTYQVVVSKIVPAPATAAPASGRSSMEDAAKSSQTATSPAAGEVLHLLPAKYAKAATSNLSFNVKEGEKNHFDIPLSD